MSWLDQVKNPMVIRLGDGTEHQPKWINASKAKEFNTAEFEFPDLDGTLVYRGRPKGARYNLEIIFDGEDHLDTAQSFWDSADDSRLWTISHPYYGSITVQPLNLNQENKDYNVSRFTATIVETITEDAPKTSVDPVDRVATDKENLDETFASAFETDVIPVTTDINTMQSNNESLYNLGEKRLSLDVDAEEYFNLFNTANAAVLDATAEPLAAARAIQAMINYPSLFTENVQNRLTCLVDQIDLLRINVETITDPNKKRIFQMYNGAVISAMTVAATTPQEGDYGNRDQVFTVVEQILSVYNTYLEDLDDMQTENGGDVDSFIPDAGSLIALNDLINFTLSNLFAIALDSRQERSFYLEDDSNAVILTHRLYGLDQADQAITDFMNQNEIGLNEILQIKKGRLIRYYV